EIDDQKQVVFADGGTEQLRPLGAQAEGELRKKPRAMVVDALFSQAHGQDIAVTVEDSEGIALFQHQPAGVSQGRGGQYGVLIFQADDFHGPELTRVRANAPVAFTSIRVGSRLMLPTLRARESAARKLLRSRAPCGRR